MGHENKKKKFQQFTVLNKILCPHLLFLVDMLHLAQPFIKDLLFSTLFVENVNSEQFIHVFL